MPSKKNDSNCDESQMSLPFNNLDASLPPHSQDKIVYFSAKVKESESRKENESRRKSINRLLSYADKLMW